MNSTDIKNPASNEDVSLGRVLKQNEEIKQKVTSAADDLGEVNDVLKQEKFPDQAVMQAVAQNENVEAAIAEAADDLKVVNVKLTEEIAERLVIESELAATKTDLAEVRDDLSKAHGQAEAAQHMALHDALTGLPNRVVFEQSLESGLSQAQRHGWGLAVLFIDVNKFKSINDTHGHDVGDQVLLTVATRLKSFVRGEDVVSRWGGDEFVCLCLEIKQEADITHLAEKMRNRIAETCDLHGISLSIQASIGIALYPAAGESADILFKNADTAMYEAKGSETGVVLFRQLTPSAASIPRS